MTLSTDIVSANEAITVAKDRARARLSGGIFELRLAGLVSARLRAEKRRRPGLHLRFLVATNMDGANPFDDVILRLIWDEKGRERTFTYFVQLKHAEKVNKPVNVHDLTAEKISKKNKDFNLRKYFEFHKRLKEIVQNPSDEAEGNRRLLREWAKGECRFVLFTTRDVLPKKKGKRGPSQLDFPFEEVLRTGQGESFCFGETDEEVWDMLASTEDEHSFRAEFLPRLRVCGGQAQVSALEPLLAQALQDAVGAPLPRAQNFLARYSSFLHHWWENDDGTCLSQDSSEVEEIVRDDIHTRLKCLTFQSAFLESLAGRLLDGDASFVVAPGIPCEFISSPLRSVLEKSHPNRFVVLTDRTFKEYTTETIKSVCSKLCDEVVFCSDNFDESMLSFVDSVVTLGTCKVRLLTSKWNPEVCSFMVSRVKHYNVWSERWMLLHLEREEQQRLLAQNISFQGHEMALAAVEEAWPTLRRHVRGATLGALAVGQLLVLGSALRPADGQYLPRTLQHVLTLRPELFQQRSRHDHFFLSGFSEDFLKKLRLPNSPWVECLSSGVPIGGHKVSVTEDACRTKWSEGHKEKKDALDENGEEYPLKNVPRKRVKHEGRKQVVKRAFSELRNKPKSEKDSKREKIEEKSKHWVAWERDNIVWKKSEGDAKTIKDYLKLESSKCQEKPICMHSDNSDFIHWKDTTLILTDIAGMGKSTFITYMSHVIKEANPSHWVIVVRISDGKIMDKLPTNMRFNEVFHLIAGCAGTDKNASETANLFLRSCLTKVGNITILVDGVDEVCPAHKIKALRLLEFLKKMLEAGGGRLWIASRSVLQEDLARALRSATFLSLTPFSPEDQCHFLLSKWWGYLKGWSEVQLHCKLKEIVRAVREATSNCGLSLCDVPLYMRMLAETYAGDDIHELFMETTSQLASSLNRAALYKKFVLKTLDLVWDKAGISESDQLNLNISSQSVLRKHGMYAAFECFYERKFLGKYYDEVVRAVNALKNDLEREKTARSGLITDMTDETPKFLHYTLAEYLAASWLQDKYSYLPELTQALYNGQFGEVRFFFDALLTEGHQLHACIISGHPKWSFVEKELIDAEDQGGRRPLHIAAICGHVDAVIHLLARGAKTSLKDHVLKWTPLRYVDAIFPLPSDNAGWSQLTENAHLFRIVDDLLSYGANARHASRTFSERRIFDAAMKHDYTNICKAFVRKAGPIFIQKWRNVNYMHVAAEHGSDNAIHMLLKLGFGVNATSGEYHGGTPLHVAASRGHAKTCSILLESNACVNMRDNNGHSALHEATRQAHMTVCHLLLNHRADINARNKDGQTPLHIAAREGHEDLQGILVYAGADVNVQDQFGRSPIYEIVRQARTLSVLEPLVHDAKLFCHETDEISEKGVN